MNKHVQYWHGVQECDARMLNSSNAAWQQKIFRCYYQDKKRN